MDRTRNRLVSIFGHSSIVEPRLGVYCPVVMVTLCYWSSQTLESLRLRGLFSPRPGVKSLPMSLYPLHIIGDVASLPQSSFRLARRLTSSLQALWINCTVES